MVDVYQDECPTAAEQTGAIGIPTQVVELNWLRKVPSFAGVGQSLARLSGMISRLAYGAFVSGEASECDFDELVFAMTRLWAKALRFPIAVRQRGGRRLGCRNGLVPARCDARNRLCDEHRLLRVLAFDDLRVT
ncbi:hypothetical protein RW1_093_00010 [Rhodococcus wratislaviensis NBRC 100605]|uniref:Uncharacterized protein n=1 Tax=Rhodococcus wratislaviensis NBRC 100605 TaxID=1219028 RepID=X0Q0H8_RHOWR|nr:hypothetical protein [Rhodococcus wratislaviensis]GAF49514.1 hypothetical protein RW1_093_00010 [Rhodococcus wratislaviensis NBRC 100605]